MALPAFGSKRVNHGLRRVAGDLISDLEEAFENGPSCSLVRLESSEKDDLFDRIRAGAGPEGPLDSLSFERLEPMKGDGDTCVLVRGADERPRGVIRLERAQGRYRVVGVQPANRSTP